MKPENIIRLPFFVLLLPVFFVVHGVQENLHFVSGNDALKLIILYVTIALAMNIFFFIFLRNIRKASLVACYSMSIFLFFGFIQNCAKACFDFISRYSVLLPVLLASTIMLVFFLGKSKGDFKKTCLFLNLLLLVYIAVDTGQILLKPKNTESNVTVVGGSATEYRYKVCDDCALPDIYFLLFDAYTSSRALHERYGYNNGNLDSFLVNSGFSLQRNSRSNYFFTAFSMASILNMSYLTAIPDEHAVTTDDYNRSANLVKNNSLINCLRQQGYTIINYSVFDLAGDPSPVNESFLPLHSKLITANTLWERLQKDIAWQWAGNTVYNTRDNNEKLIHLVEQESLRAATLPRFIYTHLYLPHAPFYFDRNGKEKPENLIRKEAADFSLQAYLEYLPYTNKRAKELLQTIITNTKGKAVIVFMGDHGFNNDTTPVDSLYTFQNQNAVYFPAGKRSLLYDSITGVNQFRVVLNTLFRQRFPLLYDSVIVLKDKK